MKKSLSSKGFTLIELLVVVAIIGILAATILASLGGARSKARLARATGELSNLRAAQELFYSSNGKYDGGFSDLDTGIANIVKSIQSFDSNADGVVNNDGSAWAYSFSDGTQIYCADSNGYAGKASNAPSSTDAQCPL